MDIQDMFYVVNTPEVVELLLSTGYQPFSPESLKRKYLCVNDILILGNTDYDIVKASPELNYIQLKQILSMKILLSDSDWLQFLRDFTKDLPRAEDINE